VNLIPNISSNITAEACLPALCRDENPKNGSLGTESRPFLRRNVENERKNKNISPQIRFFYSGEDEFAVN
jgi:hypothetical protein